MSAFSNFLFTMPSIRRGVGSVIDIAPPVHAFNRYNQSRTEIAADMRALWADSEAVLDDANSALGALVDERS